MRISQDSSLVRKWYCVYGGTSWSRRWRNLRLGVLEVSFLLPLGLPRRELPLSLLALVESEDVWQEAPGELFDLVLRDVGVVYELFLTTQCLPPTIKNAARDTAASRVLPTQSRSCRMGEKWPDAVFQGLTRPTRSPSAASLIRSIRFTQVVPPYMRCVRVTTQEIEQAMSKAVASILSFRR